MRDQCTLSRTGISLPSLRVDSFSVDIARKLPGGRRTSLTLAPEAGTQRLRDVINKGVTEADLLEAVAAAAAAGWSAIKLYFMVGLPTEEQADLEGIGDLVRKVQQAGRSARGGKKLRLSVSASSFVPKAHTPFQWEGQLPRALLAERHAFLRDLVKSSGADYRWHDIKMSFLEAALARGDRRLAKCCLRPGAGAAGLTAGRNTSTLTCGRRASGRPGSTRSSMPGAGCHTMRPCPGT